LDAENVPRLCIADPEKRKELGLNKRFEIWWKDVAIMKI
jgi:hypothetical protein